MTDGPFAVTAEVVRRDARVAGEGLLSIGPSGVELTVRRAGCDPWRADARFEEMRELVREGDVGLTIELPRGDRMRVAFATPGERADAEGRLLERCCALPELTRALRSLGSRRGATASAHEADRFFEPLLDARRRAAAGNRAAAIAAFDGAAISAALERTAADLAQSRHPDRASARRALEARLGEHLEPVLAALRGLDEAGATLAAQGDRPSVGAWRAWIGWLRAVFERADECWPRLGSELAAAPLPPATTRLPRSEPSR